MSKGVQLTKSAIDLGIVVTVGPAALAFYRDMSGDGKRSHGKSD